MSYETINQHTDYEILNEYPFTIRKKSNGKVVTVGTDAHGYPRLKLNAKDYKLHRLIALQFIPNDDEAGKPFVDHISRDRSDFHIENLRWVSRSENNTNRTSSTIGDVTYEFVDKIPADDEEDITVVNSYGAHQFEFVYFYDDVFYFYNGFQYRILHVNEDKRWGSLFVYAMNTEGKTVNIFVNKFKKLYDLM